MTTPFVDFLTGQLRITLTPAQRVLCLVSFDGVDPCQLDDADRALACDLFGDVNVIPPQCRGIVAWLKGARIGGSYLCALHQLFLGLTCPLDIAPGELAFCAVVAPDKKTAGQPYRYITGAVESVRSLRRLVEGAIGAESFVIRRPDGHRVCFEVLAASAGGSSLRGRSYISCLLDESSFFRDATTGVVNDLELYRAVAPRIVTGGCLMVISTAWARRGLLWDLVERNYGDPTTAIAVIAPTLLVRPTDQNVRVRNEEMERDPDNARREFDCHALDMGTTDFIEGEAIRQCEADGLPLVTLPEPGDAAFAGLDVGFKRDPSALVITHRSGTLPLLVAECVERRPELAGASPKRVMSELRPRLTAHRCSTLATDQHYVQTVRDELPGIFVRECSPSPEFKVQSFTQLRDLLRSRGIIIPSGNRRLISQLRDVQCTPLAGGKMRLFSPRRMGQHGDLASALVLSVWISTMAGRWVNAEAIARAVAIGDVDPYAPAHNPPPGGYQPCH